MIINTAVGIRNIPQDYRNVARILRLRRNFGKSAALTAGFEHSSGEIVVTLDGDGQDDDFGQALDELNHIA